MGRLGKKAVERIRAMLEKGYSLTETAAELGHTRKTVASYAVDTEPSPVQGDSGNMDLPLGDGDVKFLYNLQGILGASSISDAIKKASQRALSTMKFKPLIWDTKKYRSATEGKQFTVEELIKILMEHIESVEEDLDEFTKGYHKDQKIIEELEEATQAKFEEGLEQGRDNHAIYVGCPYCRKPYQVEPLSVTHELITKYLVQGGWGHTHCVKKDEYSGGAGSQALRAEMMR